MKRIIGYTRVSSSSPEQLQALQQHQHRLSEAGCTEIFTDIAPRSRDKRNGLETVLRIIARQECDEAIFIRLDRITDSPTVLERAITICLEAKIPIRALDDSIDFTTVGGRLHARILCNLARAEVERLSERVKHGHKHHQNRNAAYFAPFGYKKVGDRLELDHAPFLCLIETHEEFSRAAVGRLLVEDFLQWRSLRKALRTWNLRFGLQTFRYRGKGNHQARGKLGFSIVSLATWLNNPILRGHTAYGRSRRQRQRFESLWDIRPDTHPEHRLLTEEEYRVVAKILENNFQRYDQEQGHAPVYPLSGLVFCGTCGMRCIKITSRLLSNPDHYRHSYQCENYKTVRACSSKQSVRQEILEAALIEALCQKAKDLAAIATAPETAPESPEIAKLRAELAYYQAAPGNHAALLIQEIEQELTALLAQQNQEPEHTTDTKNLLLTLNSPLYWQTLTSEEKRALYRALVSRILIQEGRVIKIELKV